MGVKGLLPCLQSITRQVPLDKYRGTSVAVDAMCWLHKGIFTGNVNALAKYQFTTQLEDEESNDEHMQEELTSSNDPIMASTVKRLDFDKFATARNRMKSQQEINNVDAIQAMSKCIDYVTRHSMELQKKYGMDVMLVIDGASLPSKDAVNKKRRADRAESFQQGLKAERKGDSRQARKFFSRACSITYEMRHELITQCKRFRIPFIVAPYEADAQMAKLAHNSDVDLVITEDSDLLAYGCPRVLFKIDFKTGKGEEIQLMCDLGANEPLSFRHWNHDMFVYMCILAGCDYCEGVPGVGIQTAHKLVRIHRKPKKIFDALKASGKLPNNFEDAFWNAYRTFRHQRVYCSQKRSIENLFQIREVSDPKNMWDFLGPWMEPSIGIGIAEGILHPQMKVSWDTVKQKAQKLMILKESLPAAGRHTRVHERKRLPIERSPPGKDSSSNIPDDKNLFSFFRPKKRNNNDKKVPLQHQQHRPPLQEIRISSINEMNILPLQIEDDFKKIHHQRIPSNYHEYSSQLVAGNFEPISRNNPLRSRRNGVSKAIRDLKSKLSLKKTKKYNQRVCRSNDSNATREERYNQPRNASKQISVTDQTESAPGNSIVEITKQLARRKRNNEPILDTNCVGTLPPVDSDAAWIGHGDNERYEQITPTREEDVHSKDLDLLVTQDEISCDFEVGSMPNGFDENTKYGYDNKFSSAEFTEYSSSGLIEHENYHSFDDIRYHRELPNGALYNGNERQVSSDVFEFTDNQQQVDNQSFDCSSFDETKIHRLDGTSHEGRQIFSFPGIEWQEGRGLEHNHFFPNGSPDVGITNNTVYDQHLECGIKASKFNSYSESDHVPEGIDYFRCL